MAGAVLIVDDNPAIRELIGTMLKRGGYEATVVADARSALDALRQGSYGLVITDLLLPDMPGPELIRQVKRLSKAKVLVVSGSERVGKGNQLDEATRQGADQILEKPFFAAALLQAVADLLR